MWDLILDPFVTVLTGFYALTGDIVFAIVLLTVIIRLLTWPLTARQQKSAKKMQELQPRLRKLQEKYKGEREKLAQAQMELYREHGVNPLGGCLPLLIQFPILIGLYQSINWALAASPYQLIDLAQRFLVPGLDALIPIQNIWLGMDLAQPPTINPTYALALPVLVVVTTWLQTRYTMPKPAPSADGKPDQAQAMTQSMTTFMPLLFGFFALSFSVGLSIYFIASNLIGILQYSPYGYRVTDWMTREPQRPVTDDDAVVVVDKLDKKGQSEPEAPRQQTQSRKKQKPRS